MAKQRQIRQLLNYWVVATILMVLLMAGMALYNDAQYAANQQMLLEEVLPLQEAGRELTETATALIIRQQRSLYAAPLNEKAEAPDRRQLELQFETVWQSLLLLSGQLPIDQQVVLALQQQYQNFLHTDQQLFVLAIRRQQLTERLQKLSPESGAYQRIWEQLQANQQETAALLPASADGLTSLKAEIDALSALVTKFTDERLSVAADLMRGFRNWALIINGLFIAVMLGFVTLISRRIRQPIIELRQAMQSLTADNFQTRLPEQGDFSEFTDVARDFNRFAENTSQLITALDDARARLQSRDDYLTALLNSVPEAILTLNATGQIMTTNPAASNVFKTTETLLKGTRLQDFLSNSSQSLSEMMMNQEREREFSGIDAQGKLKTYWISLSRVESEKMAWVAVVSDISSWKQAKHDLQQITDELDAIFENALVGIALLRGHHLVRVNQKFETLFASNRAHLEAQNERVLHISDGAYARFVEQAYPTLEKGESFQTQIEMQRLNGQTFWCALSGQAVAGQGSDAAAGGSIWLFEDVSIQRQNEERLTRLAHEDSLTGLPNRGVFNDRLEHAIHKLQRKPGRLAVLFIDLDHFKHINDSLGHKAGDNLLCDVGRRIRSCVRESDTLARLGGDEFTVVLEDIDSAQFVGRVADKILAATTLPFMIDNIEVNISPSIGISLYPADGRDADILVRNADAAMYHAKNSGRNNYQFYSAEMNAEASNRLALETSLRHAVEHKEFYLELQPQIDLVSGEVSGAEALLRWHSEQWGQVSPAVFIPVLEDTGLIGTVGEWVLRQACQLFMMHRDQLPPDFIIAVNLSGRQFKGGRLLGYVRQLLNEIDMPASNLELEITESLLMDNTALAIETLRELSHLGVKLAIDDFGTGYSSLSYLKQFPLNVLKVDRTFISDITTDKDDAAIVGAILAMADSLGLSVVAEGVETAEQLALLKQKHCQRAQGFYFSKSLNIDDFMRYVREHQSTHKV
ncbi:diguanylate cyclase/phosphodiesterase (GGDEF & EAL domains) with PAS/PAC sensor(s) [Methylophaga frappieri]|uniref:Diguanylate cyclase/phosphodiesterase (GGDEF & EAL domains) with PAS/PAC sensor(S) n=1 Tax=Methylophaga frappieri (strain ATCC BAA-2434 / DSM 25690 / JAM7) TaxID=754477 RepID=I1YFD1_METFJ|nr:EAL domain-containing protein [Methylophaga frappieri]AFJ01624.1 diguanylate cyclase/phosphodiesterase (GGDEF & EAL domains) with PAS/PAC sensor(s) [Methylophaga frappieri]